jgi:hypothetical protein
MLPKGVRLSGSRGRDTRAIDEMETNMSLGGASRLKRTKRRKQKGKEGERNLDMKRCCWSRTNESDIECDCYQG